MFRGGEASCSADAKFGGEVVLVKVVKASLLTLDVCVCGNMVWGERLGDVPVAARQAGHCLPPRWVPVWGFMGGVLLHLFFTLILCPHQMRQRVQRVLCDQGEFGSPVCAVQR